MEIKESKSYKVYRVNGWSKPMTYLGIKDGATVKRLLKGCVYDKYWEAWVGKYIDYEVREVEE